MRNLGILRIRAFCLFHAKPAERTKYKLQLYNVYADNMFFINEVFSYSLEKRNETIKNRRSINENYIPLLSTKYSTQAYHALGVH